MRAPCCATGFTPAGQNQNYALGFHDKADLEIDHIGVTEGYTSANVDSVDVTVHGIGGHGAYVYRTKDPIVLAAEMINPVKRSRVAS